MKGYLPQYIDICLKNNLIIDDFEKGIIKNLTDIENIFEKTNRKNYKFNFNNCYIT